MAFSSPREVEIKAFSLITKSILAPKGKLRLAWRRKFLFTREGNGAVFY